MNISFNWLKDFIELEKSPEEVAKDLTSLGTEVEEVEKQGDDYIFKLEITPNRGDLLSHLGIARELGALYRLSLCHCEERSGEAIPRAETASSVAKLLPRSDRQLKITNTVPELCPRYTYRIIENVDIKESSELIKKRLESYGFRALNNLVDATNYVMIELGMPLHAFDLDKIKKIAGSDSPEIIIRKSKKREAVTTLDGTPRDLPEGAIVYEVNGTLIDLAGIMGGLNSEVDENTKNILLQGSIFEARTIRKTSKLLRHTTDASYRYERGVDFEGGAEAINRATELILESCPKARGGVLNDEIYEKRKKVEVSYKPVKINKFIGIDLRESAMEKILRAEGIKATNNLATIPSWRHDLKIWQDIAEEVARFSGYHKIKPQAINITKTNNQKTPWYQKELLKDKLAQAGLTEVYNYSFISKEDLKLFNLKKENLIEVENPVAENINFLRPSLLPGILKTIAKNPDADIIEIFEIGNVFENEEEKTHIAIATAGKKARTTNVILGLLPFLQKELGTKESMEKQEVPTYEQIESIFTQDDQKGVLSKLKIRKKEVAYVEIDLSEIIKNIPLSGVLGEKKEVKYKEISKFPGISRDIAFVIDKDTPAEKVAETIVALDEKIKKAELFDEFASDKFGLGKKNIAYHLLFQADDHTMTDKEGSEVFEKIVKEIKDKFWGNLRTK